MRIAFVVDCFPSISETFILSQITKLIDLDNEVTIFSGSRSKEKSFHPDIQKYNLLKHTCYHNYKPQNKAHRIIKFIFLFLINFFKYPKIVLMSLNFFKYGKEALSLTLFFKTILFLNKGPFDIIQCHFGPNGNMAVNLKEIGIPGKIVTMFHSYDIRKGIEKGSNFYKNLFEKGDLILSISNFNFENLIKLGADHKKIRYLPVGIDLNTFNFKPNNRIINNEPISIITIARLHKVKGLKYALEAINELIYKYNKSNFNYQIIGGGPLENELREIAIDLKISEFIKFLGPQNQVEVIDLLKTANIFLLSSIAEALPVSLMEAHAVGLPIITTSVGSVNEIVIDNVSGFIVKMEDSHKLAEKLNYLIENPQIWEEMGKKGRENIENKFDIDRLTVKLFEIYKELLNVEKS